MKGPFLTALGLLLATLLIFTGCNRKGESANAEVLPTAMVQT